MRGFLVLIIVYFFLLPAPADALFVKKNYKQNFLNQAQSAEKVSNNKAAFALYEKALFYYKDDRKVLAEYAAFCERNKYYEKAQVLYGRLYSLTKDEYYLYKEDLAIIRNNKLPSDVLEKLIENKILKAGHKNELRREIILRTYDKKGFKKLKKHCDSLFINSIDKNLIRICVAASEKTTDYKSTYKYYLKHIDLFPNEIEVIKKAILLAEKFGKSAEQELLIKKMIALNPDDNGIKYSLAGLYEKQKRWEKAKKFYEELMSNGDKSEHVLSSYKYVQSELSPKKIIAQGGTYKPRPLTKEEKLERALYQALDANKHQKALPNINALLRLRPNNMKFLRLKADIDAVLKNYKSAAIYQEKLNKINQKNGVLSIKDVKTLAFYYEQNKETKKALEMVDTLLKKYKNNFELLDIAIEYSMKGENYDSALKYVDEFLIIRPDDESKLKLKGDLYAINKDFPAAVASYEKLVQDFPTIKYQWILGNLYMANDNFAEAEQIFEPIYNQKKDNPLTVDAFLDSILAQDKLQKAYWIIKEHGLEKTRKGYTVLADLDMLDKRYEKASNKYRKALDFKPDDLGLQNKLAQSYRMMGYLNGPTVIFKNVLKKEPKNPEARLGLGSLQIDRKNYDASREIFKDLLKDYPDYRPAKVGIAHSYIAADYKLEALSKLRKIPDDEETKLIKAQAYYDMNMWSDSKHFLKGMPGDDAVELRYKIRRDEAITVIPKYEFLYQKLSQEFKLDYHKFATHVSKNIQNNTNIFMDYNVIVYSSGGLNQQNNVVNEFRTGFQTRPSEQWEYRADIGVKAFEFGGGMINTDSWIKHYFSDKFDLKFGFRRDNIEQSYLSAVGGYNSDGQFAGRAADNRAYLEFNGKLPYRLYYYGRLSYGVITMINLETNQYTEGMIGVGRLLYNNPKNKWINTVAFDVVSYNSAYQYNLLKIYDSTGQLYGGYFSPSYFNATTGNIKIEGNIEKWKLKYGIKTFGGIQNALTPDQTALTWGVAPYIEYKVNDNVSINASYTHYTFADIQRDLFMINAVIRGFKRHAKN